jgi:hypothetical protein
VAKPPAEGKSLTNSNCMIRKLFSFAHEKEFTRDHTRAGVVNCFHTIYHTHTVEHKTHQLITGKNANGISLHNAFRFHLGGHAIFRELQLDEIITEGFVERSGDLRQRGCFQGSYFHGASKSAKGNGGKKQKTGD